MRNELGQRSDPTGALARLDMIAINDGDAGGIVAAIFELAQPLDEDGDDLFRSDVANDSAHEKPLSPGFRLWALGASP